MKNHNKTKNHGQHSFMYKAILLALIIMCIVSLSACGSGNNGEKIVWSDLILGEKLPELPETKGRIHYNNAEQLYLELFGITETSYNKYIEACKEKGFTIDSDTNYSFFTAYNSDGYKLNLSYFGSLAELQIDLDIPMEMTTIKWPAGSAGKILPAPKSDVGKFSYEYDDHFFVYIGNTTKDDFWEYVTTCSEKGFNVDYNKGDNYYSADNSEGWHINLNYEGFNIMSISIDVPEETEPTTTVSAPKETKPATTEKTTEKKQSNDTGLDPDFKAAMDSYEGFMDEYVAFMKKYYADPSDLSLLADYTDYISKYSDFVDDFEKWEDEDLNADELSYYIEVQGRVSQKLLELY